MAVGHTADDNAETILHHLFRGSGPVGLAGIAPFRPLGADAVLVRPLLGIRRGVLRDWLTQLGIKWREDSSNDDVRYTRNWIRHELLPLVESRYPGATGRVAVAGVLQRQWRDVIERMATEWLSQHELATTPDRITLRRDTEAEATVVIEAAQQVWRRMLWPRVAMTTEHWQRIAGAIITLAPASLSLPGSVQLEASGVQVEFTRL